MIRITDFVTDFLAVFPKDILPWDITKTLSAILPDIIKTLGDDYTIIENIAIHKTAIVEKGVVLKAPVIISGNCFIGAHAYLRGGVYLGDGVSIGPGCEIKASVICANSAMAHFNFVGDSIIGSDVNMEAGAVIANHHNERTDKTISVYYDGKRTATNSKKFGALIGDNTKVGANAVLSPGTILGKASIIKRLELVDQSI